MVYQKQNPSHNHRYCQKLGRYTEYDVGLLVTPTLRAVCKRMKRNHHRSDSQLSNIFLINGTRNRYYSYSRVFNCVCVNEVNTKLCVKLIGEKYILVLYYSAIIELINTIYI